MEVQFYFIEKAINELTQIYNTYNPQPQLQIITENNITKEIWDNTLKDEKDILTVKDLIRIFRLSEKKRTANNIQMG